MPRKPRTRCPRCRALHDGGAGQCAACRLAAEEARGTATERGYGAEHRNRFRKKVLQRQPICLCRDQGHGHGPICGGKSSRADHWPLSRKELVERGMDPNDPDHGRGLCASCDSKQTAERQPGGWNRRD